MNRKQIFLTMYIAMIILLSATLAMAFERTLYSKTVEIKKGEYFGIGVSVKANETYTFSFNSTVPVDLVVITNITAFNDSFFANNSNSVPYLQNYSYFNITEVTFNFTNLEDGRFYFIIENANFFQNGAIGYDNCNVTINFSLIIYSSPGFTWLIGLIALIPVSIYLRRKKVTPK